jgi:hypothetical protein
VTGADLLHEAAVELYSADPDEFVARRKDLAARARAAGDTAAAKQIGGLRKPTRSAWIINQLVRAAPGVPSELASLGDELRAAQGSLDGAAIRELSQQRRRLIENLTRQAFTAAGLDAPPAALRDEVTATLGAALADPEVARQMAAGAMARVAHRDGLGPPDGTELALATPSPGRTKAAGPARAPARAGSAKMTAQERAQAAAEAKARAAEEAAAARERRRQEALAEAEQAVAVADRAAEEAAAAEQELEHAAQQLEEDLADARRRLTDARLMARRARNGQRHARRELDRWQK